ncbi:peptidoglycan recognition family protein [Micromonospora sp. NPDC023888]|uniref:peptidoglycan recognition protein family protein n=1 Tax=Micromonospora sp. NPDC023888 TaxID=3155607 RepID=UPI0033D22BF5
MVSRRRLLSGAAGAAVGLSAAGTFGGSATAAPSTSTVTSPLAARRGRLMSRTVVTSPAIPLTHLSVAHNGPAAAVRLRTGKGWSDWLEISACPNGRDGRAVSARSDIVVVDGATGYEVQVADGSAATVVELNMVDGARRTVASAETNSLPLPSGTRRKPTYLPRSGWGADESLRLAPNGSQLWPTEFYPVQTLTVHHSGVYQHNEDPDPAATVRAIYYDQCVLQEFGDIGYHLLIDEAGRVYEGRYSDPGPQPVYGPGFGGDGRPLMVNAAHVGGYNAGNIGVCLLGRYSSILPTPAAQRSLALVLAGLSGLSRLNPTGRTGYVNPVSGVGGNVAVISGHRDWASVGADPTECPGDYFYPYLGQLRQEVATLAGVRPTPPPRPPRR